MQPRPITDQELLDAARLDLAHEGRVQVLAHFEGGASAYLWLPEPRRERIRWAREYGLRILGARIISFVPQEG